MQRPGGRSSGDEGAAVTQPSSTHDRAQGYRPQAAFRIGVAGERTLDPAGQAALQALAHQALVRIADTVRQVAAGPAERAVYRAAEPVLHCLSTLAGDGDAVLARTAIEAGFQLGAVLPWPRENWPDAATGIGDDSRRALAALIDVAGSRVLQLDGTARDVPRLARPARDMAREAAARLVARNCDFLLAIWSGAPGAAEGDVAATVHAALAGGVPVLWLQPGAPPGVCLVPDQETLRGAAPGTVVPVAALAEHVRKLVALPPKVERPEAHGIHRVEELLFSRVGTGDEPVGAYLGQTLPSPTSFGARFGRLFFAMRNLLAGRVVLEEPPVLRGERPSARPPSAAHFEALFERPDALATYYAGRYRTTFLSVFILGALATSMVLASALYAEHKLWLLGAELVMLAVVWRLLSWERSGNCHGHWLDYRLLAETLRLQQALAPLAHSVSLRPLLEGSAAPARRREWVSWYFAALLRERPLDGGRLDGKVLELIRNDVHDNLLASRDGQILYFERNAKRYRNAGRLLQGVALIVFPLAVLLILLKLALPLGDTLVHFLTLCAGLLPTFATAMFAIRSHGEFEVLAQNGERIEPQLRDAAKRLAGLDLAQPLASEVLAAEVRGIETIILSDIQGWSLLFNVKVVEA